MTTPRKRDNTIFLRLTKEEKDLILESVKETGNKNVTETVLEAIRIYLNEYRSEVEKGELNGREKTKCEGDSNKV